MAYWRNFAQIFRKNAYSQLSTVTTQLFWNHIRNETAKTAEYAWNMQDEAVTNAGISSYSGLERWDCSPGPSIFRGIFRNTKFWRTLYIPKDIPEYLVDAKSHTHARYTTTGFMGFTIVGGWENRRDASMGRWGGARQPWLATTLRAVECGLVCFVTFPKKR